MAKRQKKQPIRKNTLRFRVNDQIRIPDIRLVGDNLKELSEAIGQNIEAGIYPTRRVIEWADRVELDLVEISPNAKPPVCQIIDYKKFLYMRKKKEKEIKSNAVKTVVKEIRFGPQTDEHDYEFKKKNAIKFLQDGAKLKAFVFFKGRSIIYKEQGQILLLRLAQELEEYGKVEQMPVLEGKRMIMYLASKKKNK